MNTQTCSANVAVVCDRHGGDAAAVQTYLQQQQLQAEWYEPGDSDDLDRAVREGRLRRVIFARLDHFLTALWSRSLTAQAWLTVSPQMDFACGVPAEDRAWAAAILRSWVRWQRGHRRRQTVSGLILSAIALAAAFILLALER